MAECIGVFGPLVWSLARRYTRCSSDAQDAAQDAFVRIWRNAHRFDPTKGSATTFVAVLARRSMIDRVRRSMKEPPTSQFDVAVTEVPDLAALDGVALPTLDIGVATRILSELRPEQRRVIELAFWEGMTQSEIARALRLPLGTVKSCMRRGLLAMREAMNRREAALKPKVRPRARLPVRRIRFAN